MRVRPDTVLRVDEGSMAARAYAAQQAQCAPLDGGDAVVHLPIAARGDRLGVLRLTLPHVPDLALGAELWHAAELLGESLAVVLPLSDCLRATGPHPVAHPRREMQWQLLPARSYADTRLALAGQLEPAYSIAGDSFDWSFEGDVLWAAAVDGNGRGLTATLATTVAITALRNARRAGAPLADQALYAQFGGERLVSTLLVEFDLRARVLRAIDAGSPQLLRLRGNKVTRLELEAQLPLGALAQRRGIRRPGVGARRPAGPVARRAGGDAPRRP